MVSNMENLNPQVTRYIAKELQSLCTAPMEGIAVLMDEKDLTQVEAVIDGPADTPYAGGFFRVKLSIGKDFPGSPPRGYFLTKIFHPNVSSKGEICVNTLKKDWKSDLGLKHVLLTIKCLLIVPNPESALNEEAGKLLLERYDDYCARAKLYTEIHARTDPRKPKGGPQGAATGEEGSGSSSKPSSVQAASSIPSSGSAAAGTGAAQKSKKDKSLKDKKKTLKRL